MECGYCGKSVAGSGFCPHCGKPVNVASNTRPPAPATVAPPTTPPPPPPNTPPQPVQPATAVGGTQSVGYTPQAQSPRPRNRGLLVTLIVIGSVVLAGGVGLSGYLLWPQLGSGSSSSEESVDASPGQYGSDTRLDTLWDRCEVGDFPACDELYATSPEGSDYERFGETCGARGEEKPGLCETLGGAQAPSESVESDPELDLLQAECEGGDFQACDDLFLASDPGSRYEEFGATCGDRGPADGNCVVRFE